MSFLEFNKVSNKILEVKASVEQKVVFQYTRADVEKTIGDLSQRLEDFKAILAEMDKQGIGLS